MEHNFKTAYSTLLGLPMCEQPTAAVHEMSFTDRHHLDIFKALHYALVQINYAKRKSSSISFALAWDITQVIGSVVIHLGAIQLQP